MGAGTWAARVAREGATGRKPNGTFNIFPKKRAADSMR